MIGNDLVDLTLAKTESNWRRKGYLDKIFTIAEQEIILSAAKPDEMVWTFWSMKEAAYKIHNRKTGIRNFAPSKLVCWVEFAGNKITGFVSVDDAVYFTETSILSDYVHTIAGCDLKTLPEIKTSIYEFPNNQFDYKKMNAGCVSHHGRFLALVY